MRHRVVITGIGAISPFGVGKKSLFENLVAGNSGLRKDSILNTIVGKIPEGTGGNQLNLSSWRESDIRTMSRGSLLAVLTAEEALRDANLYEKDLHEMGVNIGMGIADLEMIVEVGNLIRDGKQRKVSPYFIPRILTNMPSGHVSIRFGLHGPSMSSSTACATGLHAIGDAATLIAMGRAKYMIAGAVESCLNPIAITGFQRLRALSSTISRPFHRHRDGFVLSEGAAVMVLERFQDAEKRMASIYAEIKGYGSSSDAFHLTSPTNDGFGAKLCMQRCIEDSNLNVSDIGYVNAHATSTPIGDLAEARAIAEVLPNVAVSSIKGSIGHTLAAAGAIEVAVSAMCIHDHLIVGNVNLDDTDITESIYLPTTTIPWHTKMNALVNSFGFGGSHATVSLSAVDF